MRQKNNQRGSQGHGLGLRGGGGLSAQAVWTRQTIYGLNSAPPSCVRCRLFFGPN